jgi:hypothetical protein
VKIIEAMRRVKANKEKIADLQKRISKVSAHLDFETPEYGADTPARITEWAQSCHDTIQENIRLLTAIARTNLGTSTAITLGGTTVTKTLAEWIWRRREYAALDLITWQGMNDRGLKEGVMNFPSGQMQVRLIRNYDVTIRDNKIAEYKNEAHEIDSTLEVVNAVTDLIE